MLTDIDTWVLDLDNTLYPADSALAAQVTHGILSSVAEFYGTDVVGARQIQADLVAEYGTSLRGAMTTRNIDPHEFLSFERRIDYSVLSPDPALAAALTALPGRCFVYTNGSAYHAEQALRQLGLTACFDGIFDILAGDLIPKPYEESLDAFLTRFTVDPGRAVMFDDLPVNLEVPRARGMATVLVGGPPAAGNGASYREVGVRQWQVWDLPSFLHSLTAPAVNPSTM
ncbi:putative hydrolase of the HAD superfamily [Kribbella steppae]|uniref:Putative hydrolase of the HAD superfamily n=1 Tax=Kribbella steppae TaxID=2512223 RepID=A0A4R2GWZ7_9ACTN|nr:pyrimidine 5'-nucleotidase [Kribbella steppae]TCO15393.1 putative hydrolase of the HAD superfamily [Kribbella steppae]